MKAIFKDVKGIEDSQTQAEQTPTVRTPMAGKIFDWAKVNLGFLHVKIIKKMFGYLGVDFTTGKTMAKISSLSPSEF